MKFTNCAVYVRTHTVLDEHTQWTLGEIIHYPLLCSILLTHLLMYLQLISVCCSIQLEQNMKATFMTIVHPVSFLASLENITASDNKVMISPIICLVLVTENKVISLKQVFNKLALFISALSISSYIARYVARHSHLNREHSKDSYVGYGGL